MVAPLPRVLFVLAFYLRPTLARPRGADTDISISATSLPRALQERLLADERRLVDTTAETTGDTTAETTGDTTAEGTGDTTAEGTGDTTAEGTGETTAEGTQETTAEPSEEEQEQEEEEQEQEACKDAADETCKAFHAAALDKADETEKAAKLTEKSACEGTLSTSTECMAAKSEVKKTEQKTLTTQVKVKKQDVDVAAKLDEAACKNIMSILSSSEDNDNAEDNCKKAKAETLRATKAAVEAIKAVNQLIRQEKVVEHQKAEAESVEQVNEVEAALQSALAAHMQQEAQGRVWHPQEEMTDGAAPEKKAEFGTMKAATELTSPMAMISVSLGLAALALAVVFSRRTRSSHVALVQDSDHTAHGDSLE